MTHKIKSIEFDGRTFWFLRMLDKDGNWLETRWFSSKEAAETEFTEAGLNEQKEG